jgi:hypothetical protein
MIGSTSSFPWESNAKLLLVSYCKTRKWQQKEPVPSVIIAAFAFVEER